MKLRQRSFFPMVIVVLSATEEAANIQFAPVLGKIGFADPVTDPPPS